MTNGRKIKVKFTKKSKKKIKINKFSVSPIKEISAPQRGIIKKLYEKKRNLISIEFYKIK